MKKLGTIILCCLMLSALTACGGDRKVSDSSDPQELSQSEADISSGQSADLESESQAMEETSNEEGLRLIDDEQITPYQGKVREVLPGNGSTVLIMDDGKIFDYGLADLKELNWPIQGNLKFRHDISMSYSPVFEDQESGKLLAMRGDSIKTSMFGFDSYTQDTQIVEWENDPDLVYAEVFQNNRLSFRKDGNEVKMDLIDYKKDSDLVDQEFKNMPLTLIDGDDKTQLNSFRQIVFSENNTKFFILDQDQKLYTKDLLQPTEVVFEPERAVNFPVSAAVRPIENVDWAYAPASKELMGPLVKKAGDEAHLYYISFDLDENMKPVEKSTEINLPEGVTFADIQEMHDDYAFILLTKDQRAYMADTSDIKDGKAEWEEQPAVEKLLKKGKDLRFFSYGLGLGILVDGKLYELEN